METMGHSKLLMRRLDNAGYYLPLPFALTADDKNRSAIG
ncbi:Uncharacterised protein [Shewanella putrefaciens]|nr:Uncharacterised protein [Shewanella putrefaciens]